ncbi:hypothetical protein FA13DRAFT_1807631 [Coprinellus micaceus]|uniref:Uncharacterized protein n=2 Tax=Coprinellus micaceus TaxID=71717 RepID=A0A4Y7R5Y1_COPMI|nr:hypothetical protein FA13DRAFT_1807631 [Coprinellus micaceus]
MSRLPRAIPAWVVRTSTTISSTTSYRSPNKGATKKPSTNAHTVRCLRTTYVFIINVTPLSIAGGATTTFIKRGTTLPAKSLRYLGPTPTTSGVYEGRLILIKDNPANALCVDISNILNVTTHDKTTSKPTRITIGHDKGSISEKEADHMMYNAEEYRAEDGAAVAHIQAKDSLGYATRNLCYSIRDHMVTDKFEAVDGDRLQPVVDKAISRPDNSQGVSKDEYYEWKQRELEVAGNPVMRHLCRATDGAPCGFPRCWYYEAATALSRSTKRLALSCSLGPPLCTHINHLYHCIYTITPRTHESRISTH